jgi:glycerophosphoryl diester phosphodiesterase
VLEIKHATSFGALGFDVAGTIAAELRAAGWADGALPLVIESFESTVLAQVRARGIRGSYVYLLEAAGRPYDLVAARGERPDVCRARISGGLDASRASWTASASTSA